MNKGSLPAQECTFFSKSNVNLNQIKLSWVSFRVRWRTSKLPCPYWGPGAVCFLPIFLLLAWKRMYLGDWSYAFWPNCIQSKHRLAAAWPVKKAPCVVPCARIVINVSVLRPRASLFVTSHMEPLQRRKKLTMYRTWHASPANNIRGLPSAPAATPSASLSTS